MAQTQTRCLTRFKRWELTASSSRSHFQEPLLVVRVVLGHADLGVGIVRVAPLLV